MKKPASPIEKTSLDLGKHTRHKRVVPKYLIALRYLLQGSLIELEALGLYGETCLHSTISTLYNQKGIRFHRKRETHRHRGGGITHFTRYSLFDEDRQKADALISIYEADNDE